MTSGSTCDWRRCEQAARLAVLVGPVFEVAERRGVYCIRHASAKRRAVEQHVGSAVWLDWHGPAPQPRRLVGAPPGAHVLHRHVAQRRRSRS